LLSFAYQSHDCLAHMQVSSVRLESIWVNVINNWAGLQGFLSVRRWTIRRPCSMLDCCTVWLHRHVTVCETSTHRMTSPSCEFVQRKTRSWLLPVCWVILSLP